MEYDQYTVPDTAAVEPLALADIRPWPLVPFFQISLKNSELKTTFKTFRDCRKHFFRETVLEKALYISNTWLVISLEYLHSLTATFCFARVIRIHNIIMFFFQSEP